ncbi:MAG: imidazole glycerol phosphate synthase subunit HisF [Bacteroidetes bacterium]|nr:imidazole glycerol phosphate synthase subunit HisF [Bacteroidota bacterium]
MLMKRIIPCLDVDKGRTVKGINFVGLRDAGDPVELAMKYRDSGADELMFLDITATHEKRKTVSALARKVSAVLDIPFTIGGGIRSLEDAAALLEAGADKISINSAAVKRPELIREIAERFGRQFVVLAVDARWEKEEWYVYLNGGRLRTETRLLDWVQEGEALGAGEIMLTSMDHDGTKQGFAIEQLRRVSQLCGIPLIASGGAGNAAHFLEVFREAGVDAALAAGIFHFGELSIPALKNYLIGEGVAIRPVNIEETWN